MDEFSLIDRYCKDIGSSHADTLIGVGDDAAVIRIPPDRQLAISVDTMVEGVHFDADATPQQLAYKLAAVNLSDMAAMGAQPRWATLAMTLPSADADWLGRFSKALDAVARQYDVQLIGGDTTRGDLVLSMQIMGLLNNGKMLSRSGARLGDDVYVSGVLGDASLALAVTQGNVSLSSSIHHKLLKALDQPQPQVALGQGLLDIANACIDISDGLVADLGHIAVASDVSIVIDVDRTPLSTEYQRYLDSGGGLDYALSGGEDYQLAFTVDGARRNQIELLARQLRIPLTKIGTVLGAGTEPVTLQLDKKPFSLGRSAGYQHFQAG